jgi:hypothetical protein
MSGQRGAAWARSLHIVPLLPARSENTQGTFPPELYNAKIIGIGMPEEPTNLEGGRLVIDYMPIGSTQTKRLVLAFNECGMWIEAMTKL